MATLAQIGNGFNWPAIKFLLQIDDSDVAFLLNVATAQLRRDIEGKLASDVMTLLTLLGDMHPQEFVEYLDNLAKSEPHRAAGYMAIAAKTKKEL